MGVEFRVFLIEDDGREFPNFLPDDFNEVSSTVVDLSPSDPLAAAQVEMNLISDRRVWAAHWYFVYAPGQDGRVLQADPPIAFVDAEEAILWSTWHHENVTVGDLQRAAEYGFFEGDTSAVALDTRPYGDGAPLEWAEFLGWLTTIGTAASAYLGSKEAVRDVVVAANALGRVFRRTYRWLIHRGSRDPKLVLTTILAMDAWRTGTLASLLRIAEDDARVILEALGYVAVVDDLYRRDPQARPSPLTELLIAEHLSEDPLEYRWRHRKRRRH